MTYVKEYQIKKALARQGFLTPRALVVRPKDAASRIEVPWKGEVVLKAQVPFSSRYKRGWVLFRRDNPRELGRACENLFEQMRKQGFLNDILLEERMDYVREYYLAFASDPVTRGPVFLFSQRGGVEVEESLRNDTSDLSREPFDIRSGPEPKKLEKIFSEAGLAGEKSQELVRLSQAAYELYRQWNAYFVELNPVVETKKGFGVLDVKLEVDEDALPRFGPEMLRALSYGPSGGDPELEARAREIDRGDYRGSAHFVQTDLEAVKGNSKKDVKTFVGFNAVGTGVGLTAMDELVRLGFFPRNFCDTSGNPPASKIYRMTKIILSQDQIKGYFFISCVSSQQLNHTARGIIKAFKELYPKTKGVPPIPSLLVFRGAWDEEAQGLFREHGITKGGRVLILGRESSERNAARRFVSLFERKR